jgi:stearoyl-CoA desaturase (Delta-9 desaturase)
MKKRHPLFGYSTYDNLYSAIHLLVCMPHVFAFSIIAAFVGQIKGVLHIHLGHILFAWLLMSRVPLVGISMSACLHRYFAHGAFKTSRAFQAVLAFISCFTWQGGCLWWASMHIRHHSHCDQPDDPHSATQTNMWYAWIGWNYYEHRIDWMFLPRRLATAPEILFLNLCPTFVVFVTCKGIAAILSVEWALFGMWIPSLLSGLASARFNVDYHPDTKQRACRAIDRAEGDKGFGTIELTSWAFSLMKLTFKPLVGEAYHEDHHDHPRRAKRPGLDVPYLAFLRPLEAMGLIWDLQDIAPYEPDKKHASVCVR